MTPLIATSIHLGLPFWLGAGAGAVTFLVLAFTLARCLVPPAGGKLDRRTRGRVLIAGGAAWFLWHMSAVMTALNGFHSLVALGPSVTQKDHAFLLHRIVEADWSGAASLALCTAAAGALLLLERGRGEWAVALAATLMILLFSPLPATDTGPLITKWDPPPAVGEPGGEPPRIVIHPQWNPGPPGWRSLAFPVRSLLVPAGLVAILGAVALVVAAARRRPWPCRPSDPRLLLGAAFAACVAQLAVGTELLGRTDVLIRLGRGAPPAMDVAADFLRAAAPALVVLWLALSAVALGLLERERVLPG